MVRRSFTAVLERNVTFHGEFATEPYETAWAGEARWFIRVLRLTGSLTAVPQISPDGLEWCDEGSAGVRAEGPGLYSFPLREFGHWLRLRGVVSGEGAAATVIIYLAMKE
jgi:hypothetical protein